MEQKYYKSTVTGSYYAIENGELIQYAMNLDGSIDKGTSGAVDWFEALNEPMEVQINKHYVSIYDYLLRVQKKLTNGYGRAL